MNDQKIVKFESELRFGEQRRFVLLHTPEAFVLGVIGAICSSQVLKWFGAGALYGPQGSILWAEQAESLTWTTIWCTLAHSCGIAFILNSGKRLGRKYGDLFITDLSAALYSLIFIALIQIMVPPTALASLLENYGSLSYYSKITLTFAGFGVTTNIISGYMQRHRRSQLAQMKADRQRDQDAREQATKEQQKEYQRQQEKQQRQLEDWEEWQRSLVTQLESPQNLGHWAQTAKHAFVIIDSNIWMEGKRVDKIFDALAQARTNIHIIGSQLDEMCNIIKRTDNTKKSGAARWAMRRLDQAGQQKWLTILNPTIDSSRSAYADPDILRYIQFDYHNKDQVLCVVMNDVNFRVRARAYIAQYRPDLTVAFPTLESLLASPR